MSTKSSLFLTNDNEHCYYECLNAHYENEKFIGYDIFLEINKKNINEIDIDEDGVLLSLSPGSEIYSLIQRMDIEHKPREFFPTKKELIKILSDSLEVIETAKLEIKSETSYQMQMMINKIREVIYSSKEM